MFVPGVVFEHLAYWGGDIANMYIEEVLIKCTK